MSLGSRTGTPEHYLKPFKITNYGEVDIEALQCALSRASAICKIVGTQFDDSEDGFNAEILCNAMWALEGSIIQAQALLGDLDGREID